MVPKSFRLPDELMQKVETAAAATNKTAADIVRVALERYFAPMNPDAEIIMREAVKTRAFCRRMADKLYGEEKSDELLALVEGDLEEHLKKR